jgi:hypothetical protein
LLDCAIDLGVVSQSGSWFAFNAKPLGQGRDKAVRACEDDPALASELRAAVMAKRSTVATGGPALAATPEDSEAALKAGLAA